MQHSTTDQKYTYQVNSNVSCRIEGEENIILYNPDINDFILINSSAHVIWKFLEKSHTIDEICEYLMELYDKHPERDVVYKDIITLLDELGENFICKVRTYEC